MCASRSRYGQAGDHLVCVCVSVCVLGGLALIADSYKCAGAGIPFARRRCACVCHLACAETGHHHNGLYVSKKGSEHMQQRHNIIFGFVAGAASVQHQTGPEPLGKESWLISSQRAHISPWPLHRQTFTAWVLLVGRPDVVLCTGASVCKWTRVNLS